MGQFDQARQGSGSWQVAQKPLRLAFLPWQGTLSKQPAFWPSPTASMSLAMASTTGPCMNADGDELLAQGTSASFTPFHGLPRFLPQGVGDGIRIVTRRWSRVLGMPACSPSSRMLSRDGMGIGLLHFREQANAKIGSDSADIRQLALIQGSQERGDAIACISDHRVKRDLPTAGLIQKQTAQPRSAAVGLQGHLEGIADLL